MRWRWGRIGSIVTMATIWTPPSDYKGWLDHVFNRPVTKPEWFWQATAEAGWEPNEDDFLTYVAQAFERPEDVFRGFPDPQVAQGLNFLISPSCSNDMHALKDAKIPWQKRQRVIRAISVLFKDLFAKRCSPVLSAVDEKGGGPLNVVCYIWWDVIPLFGDPKEADHKDIDQEVLAVMKSALALDHVACQESALHGLGHWARHYPTQVGKMIDEFLAGNTKLRPELKKYALQARAGRVL